MKIFLCINSELRNKVVNLVFAPDIDTAKREIESGHKDLNGRIEICECQTAILSCNNSLPVSSLKIKSIRADKSSTIAFHTNAHSLK